MPLVPKPQPMDIAHGLMPPASCCTQHPGLRLKAGCTRCTRQGSVMRAPPWLRLPVPVPMMAYTTTGRCPSAQGVVPDLGALLNLDRSKSKHLHEGVHEVAGAGAADGGHRDGLVPQRPEVRRLLVRLACVLALVHRQHHLPQSLKTCFVRTLLSLGCVASCI